MEEEKKKREEKKKLLERLSELSWAELGRDWLELADSSGRAWLVERKTRREEEKIFGESFLEDSCGRRVWTVAGIEKASGENVEIQIALDFDVERWSFSVLYPESGKMSFPGEAVAKT